MRRHELKVLYEDKDIIVVIKPIGVESQSSRGMEPDMISLIRKYLSTVGECGYVGVVHRLDKPVSGIMVYAKNKMAANRLSKQISENKIEKRYQAIVCGKVLEKCGQLRDKLERVGKSNVSTVSKEGGKEAILHYRVIEYLSFLGKEYTKLEINLDTGRHHQIRVQFANAGHPLAGDRKYGEDASRNLALKAVYLKFFHEIKKEWMEFEIEGIE